MFSTRSTPDLNDIAYDGESKIEGRAGMLINDTECIKLVLNWLLEEIQGSGS